MAFGHVILKEFHVDKPSEYFTDYVRRYTDWPNLVLLEARDDGSYQAGRFARASDFVAGLGEEQNPDWKTVAIDDATGEIISPNGSIGYRWDGSGQWNLQQKDGKTHEEVKLSLSLVERHDEV